MPVWAIVTISVIGLMCAGCCAIVVAAVRMSGFNPANILTGGSPFVPTAQVIVGTPLQWRDITPPATATYPGASQRLYADVTHGDVDGDGSDELIAEDSSGGQHLLELDGAATGLSLIPPGTLLAQTWDYDGDGRADLLVDDYSGGSCTVCDSQGNQLAQLAGVVNWQGVTVVDIDGDGRDDLVLDDLNNQGGAYSIYEPGGSLLWNCVLPPNMFSASFGDTDGDGWLEAICQDLGSGNKLRALSRSGATVDYPGWSEYCLPKSCIDVDGDGRHEIFASNVGYQNLATGVYTKLDYPGRRAQFGPAYGEAVLSADIDRDGKPELITRGQDSISRQTGLYFFDATGACTYYEEMGASIEQFFVVSDDQGVEYIVLRTEDKLMIYP